MIDVKLSVEGYNRLFLYYLQGKEQYKEIHVKIRDNKIIFVCDYDSDVAIASIDLDTPEGRILSNYTECLLRVEVNNDGALFMCESCMNPNDEYIGHCYNCFVDYCKSSYNCKKEVREKIKGMEITITDLRFIDPIPNRSRSLVEKVERYRSITQKTKEDFSEIMNDDVRVICETIHLLQCQLEELCNKWNYGNFNRWDYDDIEEE